MFLATPVRLKCALITFLCSLFVQPAWSYGNQCFDTNDVVWGFNSRELTRMTSDASLDGNRNLSDAEKERRVAARIRVAMTHANPSFENRFAGTQAETPEELAELIVFAANCTGNDFSMLTGLLEIESTYCYKRKNAEGSGASGCGQFTSAPIKVFRRHLMLPGRDANGTPRLKQGMETLLQSCYQRRPEKVQEFKDLFSQSTGTIKRFMRSGEDFEMDLIAVGIYLKFYYAKAGFYYNAHTSTAGALTRYGTEPGYGNKVNNAATRVARTCLENEEYLNLIQEISCEVSEDPAACYLTTPTFEI